MTMEALLSKQLSLAGTIARFIANTNKTPQERQTRGYLESRIELLRSYWARFISTHDQIASSTDADESSYIRENVFTTTEDEYTLALGSLYDTLAERARVASGNEPLRPPTMSTSVPTPTPLPRMDLPKFSGDYLEWESFRDMFDTLIHQNTSLSNVQKLHYLKGNLTGEALQQIRNVSVTETNYIGAWTAIRERYDNVRVLWYHYMAHFQHLSAVPKESGTALKRLLDGTLEVRRALTSLGRPVEHWDDWFVFHAMQKLDPTTLRDFRGSLEKSTGIPTFEHLRLFLEGRIRILDDSTLGTCHERGH